MARRTAWEFPGGKVEPGETSSEAARRELNEELALGVTACGAILFTHREAGSQFQIEFAHVEIAGEPKPLEHDEIRWASPDELKNLPLAPSDRAFVDQHFSLPS